MVVELARSPTPESAVPAGQREQVLEQRGRRPVGANGDGGAAVVPEVAVCFPVDPAGHL